MARTKGAQHGLPDSKPTERKLETPPNENSPGNATTLSEMTQSQNPPRNRLATAPSEMAHYTAQFFPNPHMMAQDDVATSGKSHMVSCARQGMGMRNKSPPRFHRHPLARK